MHKKGFSLLEMLVVLAILAIFFAMASVTVQSLQLTTKVIKQNKQYEAISQIYNYMTHLENAIAIYNDFSNDQFLYQLPLLDASDKLVDPIKGGEWYAIKLDDHKLYKIHQVTKQKIQISPDDVYIQDLTFSFDHFIKQFRVTIDLYITDDPESKTRINIVVNLLNAVNEI